MALRNLETRARFDPEFPRTRRRMVGCSREIVGLEGQEPQRAALRSFSSCDAVWRGDHLWSVFGMLGENLLSSTRGLWSSQLRGSMDRQGWSGAGPVRQGDVRVGGGTNGCRWDAV